MAAEQSLHQGFDGQCLEAYAFGKENAWPVIEEKTAVQTRPVNGKSQCPRENSGKYDEKRGSHVSGNEKAPWHAKGLFLEATDQKSLQELGRYLARDRARSRIAGAAQNQGRASCGSQSWVGRGGYYNVTDGSARS